MSDNFQLITGSHFMGGGAHPLFVAAALADLLNDSGKKRQILNIVFSLNKQVLPKIL